MFKKILSAYLQVVLYDLVEKAPIYIFAAVMGYDRCSPVRVLEEYIVPNVNN